jgi:hypothetical protein
LFVIRSANHCRSIDKPNCQVQEDIRMSGQLCWLPGFGTDGQLTLHMRSEHYDFWRPHAAYPKFCVADHPVPRGNNGWATSQKLLCAGWTLISTAQAQRSFEDESLAA